MKGNGKKKTLLLGWDGADWKVINPLIDKGHMPNLKRLIENGTISNLSTLDPMYSPMLWSSIGTGKRPYKHGVLGFMEPTPDGKNVRPVMSVSRKCKALWNIYTQEKRKAHVVGWWPSHPAEHINGVMISNYYQKHVGRVNEPWPIAGGTVHPESESNRFAQFRVHPNEITANHLMPFVPDLGKVDQSKDKRLYALSKITAHAASLHAAFTHILRTEEWDFAALYLDAIDHYSHGFMKFYPPRRPHIPQNQYDLYNHVVIAGYRFHDMMLGRLMHLIDEDTTLMLVSDHGFQPDHLRPRDIPKEPAGPAYEHNPLGIFAAMGPNIKKDHITFGASILDITPTLLVNANLPIGEDMDGKVITEMFINPPEIKIIPSWESVEGDTGMIDENHPAVTENSGVEAIKQLEDLGYIEKQDEDTGKRLKQTKNECQFNLARAYIHGGKISNALPILQSLVKDNPNVPRYIFRLAACHQLLGNLNEAKAALDQLSEGEHYSTATLNILKGSLLLTEKKPLAAIKLFKSAEKDLPEHSANLNLQLARSYILLKRWQDAQDCLRKVLDYNKDNDNAYYELGNTYLRQSYFQEASEYYLNALGINFNNPMYHHQLGVSLFKNGQYKEAIQALENSIAIFPDNNTARNYLMEIYKNHIVDKEKLAALQASFNSKIRGTIYIVSGLPRSGTSMMMQMLEKGGLEIFTDKVRENDENNPKGYYEHEAVKSLVRNKNWVGGAIEKGLKVIGQLLPHLPNQFNYKVIYMQRDLHEIVRSQESMLIRLGKKSKPTETYPTKLFNAYKKTLKQNKEWASTAQNVEIMYVEYADVIQSPFEFALKINDFLDFKLLPELMATAVDPKLYREKI